MELGKRDLTNGSYDKGGIIFIPRKTGGVENPKTGEKIYHLNNEQYEDKKDYYVIRSGEEKTGHQQGKEGEKAPQAWGKRDTQRGHQKTAGSFW